MCRLKPLILCAIVISREGYYENVVKLLTPIVVITLLGVYGIYWSFFDIQRLKGQEVLSSISSPNLKYTITAYLNNGGATTDYAVLCSVTDNATGKEKNIYWNYHCSTAYITWIDEDTAVINGVELDVWKDIFDYRHD